MLGRQNDIIYWWIKLLVLRLSPVKNNGDICAKITPLRVRRCLDIRSSPPADRPSRDLNMPAVHAVSPPCLLPSLLFFLVFRGPYFRFGRSYPELYHNCLLTGAFLHRYLFLHVFWYS